MLVPQREVKKVLSSTELVNCFFSELRQYNQTNFKNILNADLSKQDPMVHKAFSSVVTRYFIFKEKHPEISDAEHNLLYFKLKLDLVAKYFSEYPDTSTDNLIAFQIELRNYMKERGSRERVIEDNARTQTA